MIHIILLIYIDMGEAAAYAVVARTHVTHVKMNE